MRHKYTKQELIDAIDKSYSIANVCRLVGIKPIGGNYKTIKNAINKYNIDISHFKGKGWNSGDNFRPFSFSIPLNEILVENSTYTSTYNLKNRLYRNNLKNRKCEICGILDWMGKKLSLELDHINGKNNDHRIDNLRILCPNCHSQTKNFRGRNKKRE